jgi:hypothetical protein
MLRKPRYQFLSRKQREAIDWATEKGVGLISVPKVPVETGRISRAPPRQEVAPRNRDRIWRRGSRVKFALNPACG